VRPQPSWPLSALLLTALALAGCGDTITHESKIRVDVSACLVPSAAGGGGAACGSALQPQAPAGLPACLAGLRGRHPRDRLPPRGRDQPGLLPPGVPGREHRGLGGWPRGHRLRQRRGPLRHRVQRPLPAQRQHLPEAVLGRGRAPGRALQRCGRRLRRRGRRRLRRGGGLHRRGRVRRGPPRVRVPRHGRLRPGRPHGRPLDPGPLHDCARRLGQPQPGRAVQRPR